MLGDLNEAPVIARQFFNAAQGGAKRAFGRGIAFVELIVGVHGRGIQLFRVSQHALLGFQGFVFSRFELRGVDFFALIAPEIDHAQAVLFALEQVVEFRLRLAPARMGLGHRVRCKIAEAIEQDALLVLIEAGMGFSLGVHQGQFRRKLAKNSDGSGLIVDEDAPLAVGENFTAENNLGAFRVDAVVFEDGFSASSGLETQAGTALSAPGAQLGDAFPPISSARASTRIDFPAPVSPVSRFNPGPNVAMA